MLYLLRRESDRPDANLLRKQSVTKPGRSAAKSPTLVKLVSVTLGSASAGTHSSNPAGGRASATWWGTTNPVSPRTGRNGRGIWADLSTVDLLAYVCARLDCIHALILVTYRPPELHSGRPPFPAAVGAANARDLPRVGARLFHPERRRNLRGHRFGAPPGCQGCASWKRPRASPRCIWRGIESRR